MKKETFIGIIDSIQAQRKREVAFSEAIKSAYEGAGEEPDFRESESYLPPTSVFIDAILESLAPEFISANQTRESALDVINYYMYDLDMMNFTFIEPVDDKNLANLSAVPAYIIHQNGTKLLMDTPEHLYNTLMYCKETPVQVNQKPTTPVDPKTELRSSLAAPAEPQTELRDSLAAPAEPQTELRDSLAAPAEKTTPVLNSEKEKAIWGIVKPIIKDMMDIEDVKLDDSMDSIDADSLDCVETAMRIETACGVTFTDSEWDNFDRGMPFHDWVKFILEKQK